MKKKYRVIYKRGPSTLAIMFAGVAIVSWILFLFASGFPVAQYVYYRLYPATSEKLAKMLAMRETNGEEERSVVREPVSSEWLPELDVSLPGGQYLSIPKIGVDAVIWEGPSTEYEAVLRRGVWRVPELPRPIEGTPVILVAHRFGYLEWTNEYRRKNSFFNLPKLVEGDEIEIVWDQRRFKYKVESMVEAEEIEDYSADLVLYTCKFLISPVRIIVYAERI